MTTSLTNTVCSFHARLNDLFEWQQEAIVEKKFDLACRLLELHYQLMEDHIQLENTLLLPAHAALSSTRWPSTLYRHEHDKILTLLDRALQQLRNVQQSSQTPRRSVISLLDYQRTVKNVLEHHEQREEQGLLSELTEQNSERAFQLGLQCQQHWQSTFANHESLIQNLRDQLGA